MGLHVRSGKLYRGLGCHVVGDGVDAGIPTGDSGVEAADTVHHVEALRGVVDQVLDRVVAVGELKLHVGVNRLARRGVVEIDTVGGDDDQPVLLVVEAVAGDLGVRILVGEAQRCPS